MTQQPPASLHLDDIIEPVIHWLAEEEIAILDDLNWYFEQIYNRTQAGLPPSYTLYTGELHTVYWYREVKRRLAAFSIGAILTVGGELP